MACNQCGTQQGIIRTTVERFEVTVCAGCWQKLEDSKQYLAEMMEVIEDEKYKIY